MEDAKPKVEGASCHLTAAREKIVNAIQIWMTQSARLLHLWGSGG